jgi:hypothetical protein
MFYNEIDMLLYRLNSLNDFVDYFIIVESKYTHSGKEKSLYFNNNKHLFEEYIGKIVHVILDDAPFKYPAINYSRGEQWENEHFHRNGIKNGIERIGLNDEDILIISDLDEIPDINLLKSIKNNSLVIADIFSLKQDLYYYNLNSKMTILWDMSKILPFKTYKNLNKTCTEIRLHNCNSIENGGWHLSYFGDKYFIKNKIENFGHQEFNNELYTNLEAIHNSILNQVDLYNRPHGHIIKIPIKDNDYLPYKYKEFLSKYILY